jgi:hypothetical protein
MGNTNRHFTDRFAYLKEYSLLFVGRNLQLLIDIGMDYALSLSFIGGSNISVLKSPM